MVLLYKNFWYKTKNAGLVARVREVDGRKQLRLFLRVVGKEHGRSEKT